MENKNLKIYKLAPLCLIIPLFIKLYEIFIVIGYDKWLDNLVLNNEWAGFLLLLSIPASLIILIAIAISKNYS